MREVIAARSVASSTAVWPATVMSPTAVLGPSVTVSRTSTGTGEALPAAGTETGLDPHLRVAATPVLLGQRGGVRVDRRLDEQVAFARAQQRPQVGLGHRAGAGNGHARRSELRAATHREHHGQTAVARRPLVVGVGIAISLRAQVLFDAVGRVLEQVLVHRALALNRHQVAPLLLRTADRPRRPR